MFVGIYGTGTQADIKLSWSAFFTGFGSLVRARMAAWRPDHQQHFFIHKFRGQNRLIYGVDGVAAATYPLLGSSKLDSSQSFRRQDDSVFFFLNTQHDVTTIQILKIVGKGAYSTNDLHSCAFFIPTGFKLYTRGFHTAEVQQILDIDR
jgi:hypothetical protein